MAFFHRFPICKLVWLMVVPGAWAQSTTSVVTAKSAAPALPLAPVNTNGLPYVSVFAQYKAYAEQAVSSWPQANATVERLLAQPLQLSAEVVDQVTLVRQVWVRAVVAQQTLVYTQQVNTVAQSSAELAQRMQAVGISTPCSAHAYRTVYDLARHYRDEVLPVRKTIADENLLRYNCMLIGVFDLLADPKEQLATLQRAIAADSALQCSCSESPLHERTT